VVDAADLRSPQLSGSRRDELPVVERHMLRNLRVGDELLHSVRERADRAEDRTLALRGLLPATRRKARLKLLTSL
jgi:hypothetical protein